jgi:hypothetical protein
MQIIPFKIPGAWKAQITLTDTIFVLFFRWNALNKYWVMNIYDRNETPILLGVKLVTDYDLTAQFPLTGMPTGDILCQNILGQLGPIERFDMGRTTELMYYEPLELDAVVSAQEALTA